MFSFLEKLMLWLTALAGIIFWLCGLPIDEFYKKLFINSAPLLLAAATGIYLFLSFSIRAMHDENKNTLNAFRDVCNAKIEDVTTVLDREIQNLGTSMAERKTDIGKLQRDCSALSSTCTAIEKRRKTTDSTATAALEAVQRLERQRLEDREEFLRMIKATESKTEDLVSKDYLQRELNTRDISLRTYVDAKVAKVEEHLAAAIERVNRLLTNLSNNITQRFDKMTKYVDTKVAQTEEHCAAAKDRVDRLLGNLSRNLAQVFEDLRTEAQALVDNLARTTNTRFGLLESRSQKHDSLLLDLENKRQGMAEDVELLEQTCSKIRNLETDVGTVAAGLSELGGKHEVVAGEVKGLSKVVQEHEEAIRMLAHERCCPNQQKFDEMLANDDIQDDAIRGHGNRINDLERSLQGLLNGHDVESLIDERCKHLATTESVERVSDELRRNKEQQGGLVSEAAVVTLLQGHVRGLATTTDVQDISARLGQIESRESTFVAKEETEALHASLTNLAVRDEVEQSFDRLEGVVVGMMENLEAVLREELVSTTSLRDQAFVSRHALELIMDQRAQDLEAKAWKIQNAVGGNADATAKLQEKLEKLQKLVNSPRPAMQTRAASPKPTAAAEKSKGQQKPIDKPAPKVEKKAGEPGNGDVKTKPEPESRKSGEGSTTQPQPTTRTTQQRAATAPAHPPANQQQAGAPSPAPPVQTARPDDRQRRTEWRMFKEAIDETRKRQAEKQKADEEKKRNGNKS